MLEEITAANLGDIKVSTLSAKLQELASTKLPGRITDWFSSLSDEDKNLVWDAMMNPELKSYTLLNIFRAEGMTASKDTFIPFRKSVLAGTIKRTDIDE